MYNWITLLYSKNQHNVVNQVYFNLKKKWDFLGSTLAKNLPANAGYTG